MTGWKWRDNIGMEQLAWQTAHLLNIHVKRKITIKDLLKKKATVNRNATNSEKTKKELTELEAELVPEGVIIQSSDKAS